MSGAGAGAKNGAERAQKSDERERPERDNTDGAAAVEPERDRVSWSGVVSGLNQPLTVRSNLTIDSFCKLSYIRILQSISKFRIRTHSSL